jgi:hypothetical protein
MTLKWEKTKKKKKKKKKRKGKDVENREEAGKIPSRPGGTPS